VDEYCRQDAKNKENKNNRNSKKEANSEANSEAKSRRSEMARAITALRCEDPYRLGVIEYENGNRPMANKIWRLAFDPEDHVLEISEILQSNGVNVVRAPYAASAQCVDFHNKGFCNYVFGPTDLFLFDIEKIITEFIFLGGESQIELTSKIEIMKAVKLPNNRFIDLCLMLGCEYCPTIPPYANNFNVQNVIEAAKIINDSRVSVKQFMLNFYEIFKEKGQSRGGYSENRHDSSATHRGGNNNKSINTHTNDNSNIDLSNSVDIN
ncbi:Flap endonuclease 1, partial [Dictyocoela roeselum]